ncbi:MAG: protease family protein [Solirubrobacterales bacterium]|nr:protease family protein [Solirubrobacterales bacterium]
MSDPFDPPPSQPPPPSGPPLSPLAGPPAAPVPPGGKLPAATWGPGRAFGGLGFLLVLVIGLALLVSAFDPEIKTLGAQVTLQALLAGSLIFTAFLFAGPDLRSLVGRELLGLRRPLRKPVWLAIATYFGYVGCAIVISLLLSPEQKDITRDLGGDSGTLGTVIAGFLIVVIAPISEEIFFRGFLFGGLRRAMPGAVAAVLASGIWGLFHYTGPGTWGVVVQITVFGLWLSWLYERTGSIYPTMAVHALNNAIAFTVLLST